MKNKFLILFFITLSLFCSGQKLNLTFSPTITSSNDTAVKTIAHLWENYLNARYNDYLYSLIDPQYQRETNSIRNLYWYNNSDDLLNSQIECFILFADFSTISIRKYSDKIYEIHTLVQRNASEEEGVTTMFLYKVCAIETDDGYKLINYFDVYKHALQNYNSENIEFYYPCGFNFDTEKVKNTEKFIQQFQKDYKIEKIYDKIICIIGNNLTESNASVGFDFTFATSENKFAGYHLEPKTILTCRQDHLHEFVHVLVKSSYPDICDILNEGIATYYGGTAGSDYVIHAHNLQKYLSSNTIDFSNSSLLWDIVIDNACLAYTVGAVIIDYTLKNYGTQKVIELFSCKDYDDIFSKLAIKKEDINAFFIQFMNEKF